MLTTTDCVREIIQKSPFVQETLRLGWLNLSQYAVSIQPEIEKKVWKKVQLGSIVTALGRIRTEITEVFDINISINDISLKFPITEFNFSNHPNHPQKIGQLYEQLGTLENSFLNIISGNTEMGIFINSKHTNEVLELFLPQKPNLCVQNLGAVSVKFNPEYLQTTGSVYQILKLLVWKKINLMEVISTYTELTLIVQKADAQKVFDAVSSLVGSDIDDTQKV